MPEPIRIFGYGSLIFKVDFPYKTAQPGYIDGFVRRFWQASWDHRGTHESPGRVVTLVSKASKTVEGQLGDYEANHRVFGMVYELDPETQALTLAGTLAPSHETNSRSIQAETMAHLDFREKAGYTKDEITVYRDADGDAVLYENCVLYRGEESVEEFIGPESLDATARIVATSTGPSGKNTEYLFKLVAVLKEHGVCDDYTEALAGQVTQHCGVPSVTRPE